MLVNRDVRRACILAALWIGGCGPDAEPPSGPDDVLELRTEGSRTTFMPDSLVARAGQRVTVRMTNDGEVAHNLVVVRDTDAVEPIVLAAYQAIKTEYVPTGFESAMLGSTPLVYPGQSKEVTFVMPEPGRYTYVCVFPSHGITMRGVLVSVP
jgi:plastocyanin